MSKLSATTALEPPGARSLAIVVNRCARSIRKSFMEVQGRGGCVHEQGLPNLAISSDNYEFATHRIEKIRRINEYNELQRQNGRDPIQIGIGINTGHMMVGIVGEQSRMQGDALSDNVNLTSRIEGLTKFYGVSFIITASTYQRLADPDLYCIRFLDKVQVKGKSQALDLFEVFDGDSPEQRDLKRETQVEYAKALSLFYDRDFDGAQAKLFGVLKQNPKDKVAWHHLVQATNALEKGVSDAWSGITAMEQK